MVIKIIGFILFCLSLVLGFYFNALAKENLIPSWLSFFIAFLVIICGVLIFLFSIKGVK